MEDFFWYLTRSTGIVGTVLAVAALLWGFLFSARATGKRPRPPWWLDLHNWMGGLALVFIGVHVAAAWLESADIGLTQVFVPGTATPDRWGITFGVLGLYLLSIVVFTTWPKRMANRKWWRVLHLLSIPATVFALLHSFESGSDLASAGYTALFVMLIVVSVYGSFERVTSLIQQRRRKAARAALRRDAKLTHSSHTSSNQDNPLDAEIES